MGGARDLALIKIPVAVTLKPLKLLDVDLRVKAILVLRH